MIARLAPSYLRISIRVATTVSTIMLLGISLGCGVGGVTLGGPDIEGLQSQIQSGMTLAEIEAILGNGRTPNSADFDAVCGDGEFQNMNPRAVNRPAWERAANDGLVKAWSNGATRMLVFFHKDPASGGQMFQKVIHYADGSVSLQSDSTFLMQGANQQQPEASNTNSAGAANVNQQTNVEQPINPSIAASYTVAAITSEYARNAPASDAKFRNQRVTITGEFESIVLGAVNLKAASGSGQVSAQLTDAAAQAIKNKSVGDKITISGTVILFVGPENQLLMRDCTIE